MMRSSRWTSFFTLTSLAIFTSLGCDHSNSRRMTPPEQFQQVELKNEVTILKNSNAVDILFVVDNSESMKTHQEKLAANIQHFVKSIEENSTLDYHIGIIPVFDSVRYGKEIKNFNPNGFLLPLKGETKDPHKFFYTRAHNDFNLLAQSIHIGVLPLKDHEGNYQGPEFEEALSPIYAAFTEPAISASTNKGFYRPEARLAVIIITDADDSSPGLSGTDLDYFLKNLKQDPTGSKISTFGVLADYDSCGGKVDYGMNKEGPQRILDFLDASRGTAMSLCKDNFAQMLTAIGTEIQQKAQKQNIYLQGMPEFNTLKVYLGHSEHPPGPKTWAYDPTENKISVTMVPRGLKAEDLSITIRYTEVNMTNQRNGRAKRF